MLKRIWITENYFLQVKLSAFSFKVRIKNVRKVKCLSTNFQKVEAFLEFLNLVAVKESQNLNTKWVMDYSWDKHRSFFLTISPNSRCHFLVQLVGFDHRAIYDLCWLQRSTNSITFLENESANIPLRNTIQQTEW